MIIICTSPAVFNSAIQSIAQIAQKFAFLLFLKNHPFCGAFYCFVAALTSGPLTSADRVRSENIVFVKPRCKVVAKSPESDEQMFHKCSLAVSMSQSDLRKFISNPSDRQMLPGPHKCNLR